MDGIDKRIDGNLRRSRAKIACASFLIDAIPGSPAAGLRTLSVLVFRRFRIPNDRTPSEFETRDDEE